MILAFIITANGLLLGRTQKYSQKMSEIINFALVLIRFVVRQWYLFILYPLTTLVLTQGPSEDKDILYSVVRIPIAGNRLP